jgi:hypothetical protein
VGNLGKVPTEPGVSLLEEVDLGLELASLVPDPEGIGVSVDADRFGLGRASEAGVLDGDVDPKAVDGNAHDSSSRARASDLQGPQVAARCPRCAGQFSEAVPLPSFVEGRGRVGG